MSIFKGWTCDNCGGEQRHGHGTEPVAGPAPAWIRITPGDSFIATFDLCSDDCAHAWLTGLRSRREGSVRHATEAARRLAI